MSVCVCVSILIPFNNALDQKTVFETHLLHTNISHSLQKLRQYNKKSQQHQTKINTAININYLKLQKDWNFKILKNYLCSEAVLQRCSPRKMLCKYGVDP